MGDSYLLFFVIIATWIAWSCARVAASLELLVALAERGRR